MIQKDTMIINPGASPIPVHINPILAAWGP